MTSWWDRTDPSDQPGRAPLGFAGAWWNVVACAGLLVGMPVIALSTEIDPPHIAFAVFGTAIALALELVLVRQLVQRISGRRALRAERADADEDAEE